MTLGSCSVSQRGNASPERSFKIHAALLYQVNDASYVPLQADGDAHEGGVVVQLGSEVEREKPQPMTTLLVQ